MLKFLVPKMIKEFDKKLLLNYPFWYIVKIHYIIYFTLLMWVLSLVIGNVLPIDITSNDPTSSGNVWIFIFSVLAIILFCIWMYYLTIYNNEDHFGKFNKYDDVKFLVIFFVGINLLLSFSYPMLYILKSRLANTFTDEQLAQQCNTCNLANKYITSNIEDFQYCGYDIHQQVTYDDLQKDTSKLDDEKYKRDLAKYNNFNTCSFLSARDNFDFCYLFLPKYEKESSSEFNRALYTPFKIEEEYKTHTTESAKLNAITNYFSVAKWYQGQSPYYQHKYSPQDYLDNYNHIERICVTNFPEAYNLSSDDKINSVSFLPSNNINYNMDNIYKAKFSLPGFLSDEYLIFAFYFSFFISLFIILFRNNKWQHYLVSVVSFILIGIILGIISAIFQFLSFPYLFPTLSILVWISAGVISVIDFFKKDRYHIIGVVASNLFYICLPIMPFLISVYAHDAFGLLKCDYVPNEQYTLSEECLALQSTYSNLLVYSQIIGIILFVVLIMPLYKLYFVKQKALPTLK